MVLVIHNGDEIKYTENIGLDFLASDVLVVKEIPKPEQRDGYCPVLKYNETENKLFYDYIPIVKE